VTQPMTPPEIQPVPIVQPQRRIPTSAYKVAVFAVVTLLLFGLLAMLIGNLSFVDRRTYHADFTEATGVTGGDRVRLSGVEVGRVTSVELVPDGDAQRARVTFTVEEGVPVYSGAQLVLRYENIVGQRYLEIQEEIGDGEETEAGHIFPISQTTPALNLTVLFNGFQPLFQALDPAQVNEFSYLIVQAVQGEGATYQQLLSSTASLTDTLADKDAVIGRVVDNLGAVLRTVDERDTKLTELISTFRRLMGGLADDRGDIAASLPGLSDLLTVSTGFLADVRGPLAADLTGLDDVVTFLDRDRSVLEESLQRLPFRMRQMARTGSYGSTFNYYACGISGNLRLLGSDYLVQSPNLAANERDTICGREDVP